MYGWAHNCLKELIVGECGSQFWVETVEQCPGVASEEWKDTTLYPDNLFADMIDIVVKIPLIDSDRVLAQYWKYVLKYFTNCSLGETCREHPISQSLYDHVAILAAVHAVLDIMCFPFFLKVWCSKCSCSDDASFYLYTRMGDDDWNLTEATVQAVASQYFGAQVIFDCTTLQRERAGGSPLHKRKITLVPPEIGYQLKGARKVQGMSPQQLDVAFPYHIVFDSYLKVVQTGVQIPIDLTSPAVNFNLSDRVNIFDGMSKDGSCLTFVKILSKLEEGKVSVVADVCLTLGLLEENSLALSGDLVFCPIEKRYLFLCSPTRASSSALDAAAGASDQGKMQKGWDERDEKDEGNERRRSVESLRRDLAAIRDQLATKQKFVRYVSHEIRTPLMVVDTGLGILKKELQKMLSPLYSRGSEGEAEQICIDPTPSDVAAAVSSPTGDSSNPGPGKLCEVVQDVGTLESCLDTSIDCKRAMGIAIDILNDLLAYEKIEAGIMQLTEIPVLVSRFFQDVISEFRLQAHAKSIAIDFKNKLPPELISALYLIIDKKKIQQVVRNFLSNALKFSSPHGTITITLQGSNGLGERKGEGSSTEEEAVEREFLKSLRKAGSAEGSAKNDHISVNGRSYAKYDTIIASFLDTGAGISKENQPDLFNKIVQFRADELQDGGGSGIGLYISSGIVKEHGGSVGLFSKGEGEGSNFFFSLPLYLVDEVDIASDNVEIGQSADETDGGAEDLTKVFSGMRVLVADDSPMVRKMLSRALTMLGSEVSEACDGHEAIDLVKARLSSAQEDKNKVFDLIMMDDRMPRVSGQEAAEIIMRKLRFPNLMVGVTGSVLPARINDFLSHGVTAVLPKPLVLADLAKCILDASERK